MAKSGCSLLATRFSIIVSAFGFFIIIALAALATRPMVTVAWRKPLVGSIFSSVCILGIILALSPRKCSETFGHQKWPEAGTSFTDDINSVFGIKGHHYDCGKFSAHTVHVGGHVLCAACTGLLLGALGALLGTVIYFFVGWECPQVGSFVVVLGVTTMVFGFLQLKFGGLTRLILNMLFVLGAFFILAGMDGLVGRLWVDLFSLVLIAFWIFTRVLLSKWDHWKICRRCSISCENKDKEKWG